MMEFSKEDKENINLVFNGWAALTMKQANSSNTEQIMDSSIKTMELKDKIISALTFEKEDNES